MPKYVECAWFIGCHNPSEGTVDHPTLGNVEICREHIDWLQNDFSPTKMVPPILAAKGTNVWSSDTGWIDNDG